MACFLILHTATRVIRRITTDPAPSLDVEETAVSIPAPVDIAARDNGDGTKTWWKFDLANQMVPASDAEVTAADVDPERVRLARAAVQLRVQQAIDAAAADNRNTASVREYFAALQALRRFR